MDKGWKDHFCIGFKEDIVGRWKSSQAPENVSLFHSPLSCWLFWTCAEV